MKIKLRIVLATVLVLILSVGSLYAWQGQSKQFTDEDAVETAVNFLKNNPTFKFDGILDSINVVKIDILESYPEKYVVIISFNTSHPGHGDRTGTFTAHHELITPHQIIITVKEGEVIEAIIDDMWDEVNQRLIPKIDLQGLEAARDYAIEYLVETHDVVWNIPTPEYWMLVSSTPDGLVDASTLQFIGEGWIVDVNYPVVEKPTYTVKIDYDGEINFQWKGIVDQDGTVTEISFIK